MKKLLKEFEKEHRIDKNEKFLFSTYPIAKEYETIVTNYGRVFSFSKDCEKNFREDKDGYKRTSIPLNKQAKNEHRSSVVGIHRLIAWEFCFREPGNDVVNHIDGNKQNNIPSNLEWTTPLENTRHALRTGLQCNSGPDCPSAIYSEDMVRLICRRLEEEKSLDEIYKEITGEEKITNRRIYSLIFSIKQGIRHATISKEYNFVKGNNISHKRPKFTKEEVNQLIDMIKSGMATIDIMRAFHIEHARTKKAKRLYDKIKLLRKDLGIPNPYSGNKWVTLSS